MNLALDHHRQGRMEEAGILYGRILDADPDQPDALHLLGLLRAQQGHPAQALELVDRALALRGDRAAFHVNRAKLALVLGRPREAGHGLRRALALDPAAADAWEQAASLAEHGIDPPQDPRQALSRAVRLGRRDLAARLAALGRQHGDAILLGDAVAAGACDADTFYALANARLDAGRPAPAARAYRATLCLRPDAHAAFYNLGVAAFSAGDFDTAERAFARAGTVRPDDLQALDYRAVVLHTAHRLPEAAAQTDLLLDRKNALAPAAPPLPEMPSHPGRRRRDVIAFSLWGDRPDYTQGAIENVRLARELYPGWICRIYHDDSVPAPVLAALDAAGAERVAMPVGTAAAQGTLWRFLVSDDPDVARFLCRDADSRLNRRERAAVDEWLASPHPFHVLRDHVLHSEVMLAGLWGGLAGLLPPLPPLFDAHTARGTDRLSDQRFLRDVVWPRIRTRCLVHDSAHPRHGRPFPPVSIEPRFAFTHVGASVRVEG
ncbi:tetratricopeptide repeat protein [Azospirillum agricola]|uniref:tetratricopeptide repeat protein n=1 Tax=Azospirillum agricola TaxID=1720247 RepID=UPI001CC10890|nr:tetratricopeptide repeat protein [Azospirillum agricola]